MTDEEIHNIYLHMSGKAEGLVEANGTADFPVLFARAILEYEGLTKDMQNMASKSTYKEQLETKDELVAWGVFEGNLHDMFFTKEEAQEMAKLKGSHAEIRPLYTTPQRTWVGLTNEETFEIFGTYIGDPDFNHDQLIRDALRIEAKLKEKNT